MSFFPDPAYGHSTPRVSRLTYPRVMLATSPPTYYYATTAISPHVRGHIMAVSHPNHNHVAPTPVTLYDGLSQQQAQFYARPPPNVLQQQAQFYARDPTNVPQQQAHLSVRSPPNVTQQQAQFYARSPPNVAQQQAQFYARSLPTVPQQQAQFYARSPPNVLQQQAQVYARDPPNVPQQQAHLSVRSPPNVPQQQNSFRNDNPFDTSAAGISRDPDPYEPWMSVYRSRVAETDALTPQASESERITALSLLAGEFQVLSTITALARRRSNVLTLMNRLPTEILTYIFAILTDVDPPKRVSFSSGERIERVYYRRLGWIRVTHVCSSWRQQALANFRLWTNIDAEHTPVWMDEVILRSRQMPLAFSLDIDRCHYNQWNEARNVVERVLSPAFSPRLSRFHFKIWCQGEMNSLLKMLVNPAPLLEELELRTESPMGSSRDLNTIFASSMPRLRRLALEGWAPSFEDLPYLRNLTSLEIVNARKSSSRPVLVADCIDVLTHSPLLESLILKGIFKSSETTNCARAPVALDRLSMLGVQSTMPELVTFLRGLRVPVTSAVEIDFAPSPDGLADLLPLLAPFATADIDRLAITYAKRGRGYPRRFSWAAHHASATKLRIEGDAPKEAGASGASGALQQICKGLRADGVRALGLRGNELDRIAKTALQDVLRCVPALERLALYGEGTCKAIELLGRPMRRGGRALCPALTNLEVGDVCLSNGCGGALLVALPARRSVGVPVETLTLVRCQYASGLLEQLGACKVHLRCNACVCHELVDPGEGTEDVDDGEDMDDGEDGEGGDFFV